ncbi:MarR family transcriptional regulator [Paenarthrobacter sp. Z7-10]|uniref:MarR family winged helix-turn-helix transcriptional regulator n=1 Tax=Paenarthrobacter sp. Z7-10 TaxID=2787635 RepID=UPI0022A9C22F|nr:MarR family transcriptional regulator [Paenarthrobacter sp. Z7-10]MCZ2404768.1 MarR family transcriptional regulator [Paenarthrobacter sp. Z7-10]
METPRDYIDGIQEQWGAMLPQVTIEAAGVVGRIRRLAQIIQLRGDAVLARHGISRSEFDILSALARNDRPMTPTELAAELLISGAGMTKRIKKLTEAKLIRRDANPEDGRGALLRMTEQGQQLILPVLESISAFESGLLDVFAEHDRRGLTGQLRTLLSDLEHDSSLADPKGVVHP